MSSTILPANIALKRAYESPSEADGVRILVDRLWPRGVTKKAAAVDRWAKDVAPSTELRKWFGHEPARWKEFGSRYRAELKNKQDELDTIRELAAAGPITLIYAAHDTAHSHAIVLRDALLNIRAGTKSPRG
jgi:uncharacterized protein YeaO (DUF488 family)